MADVAQRKSGKCFTGLYLPPGFGGVYLPLPRAMRVDFLSLPLNFFAVSFIGGGILREGSGV